MLISCVERLKRKALDSTLVDKVKRLFRRFDKNRNSVICINEIRRFARKICGQKTSKDVKSVMNSAFDLNCDCDITIDEFTTAFGYLDPEEADAAITGMLKAFKDYRAKRQPKTESVESFISTLKKLGDLSVTFANEQFILENRHQSEEKRQQRSEEDTGETE